MAEIETQVERYLTETIAVLGGSALKYGVVGIRGYPDRLCILPGGHMFFVECKRPKGGRLAELQKVRREELQALGCRVYVVKNRGEIDAIIETHCAGGVSAPAQ